MSTWTWTAGLAGLALMGTAVAMPLPRLSVNTPTGSPPTSVAPPAAVPVDLPAGEGVTFQGALDKGAVLRGTHQERFLTLTIDPAMPDTTAAVDRPLHLGIVLDRSGSMSGEGKWDEAMRATRHLMSTLGGDDRLTLVSFSDHARAHLTAASPARGDEALRPLQAVGPGGGTNLHAGLQQGAAILARGHDARLDRLVVLSDGQANVGITDPGALASLAARAQADGASVSAIGLGLDFEEDVMSGLADAGGGTYAFVDAATDLASVFEAELERAARLVGRTAVVRLTFSEGVTPQDVLGWPSTTSGQVMEIPIGDLYGASRRKVVVRLDVAGTADASMPIVDAQLSWTDATTEAPAAVAAHVTADVTEAVAVVEASVDADASQAAYKAWGNVLLDRSTRAYAKGDSSSAVDLAKLGSQAIEQLRSLSALGYITEDEAKDEQAAFEEQVDLYLNFAPASAEGKRAVKAGKEKSRHGSR